MARRSSAQILPRPRAVALAMMLGVPVWGCAAPADSGALGGSADAVHGVDTHAEDKDIQVHRSTPAGAGWIMAESSWVLPYCPAVAVSSSQALVTSACIQAIPLAEASFGLATPGEGVARAVLDAEAVDDELSRVTFVDSLNEPVVPPAIVSVPHGVHDVRISSFAYVAADDASWTWLWSGTLEVDEAGAVLSPDDLDEMEACHGDVGAGVYLASGQLVGIITGVREASQCAELLEVRMIQPDIGQG